MIIRRLEENDETTTFDCGDAALNNFLKRYAWINQEKISIGVTYVAVDEPASRHIFGYFTLAAGGAPHDVFPAKFVRGLPRYDLPLILLARLAVHQTHAGRGIGHALMSEVFRISLQLAEVVGCRWIIADAYRDRIGWYQKYGFLPVVGASEKGPQRMFLDLRTLRKTPL